MYSSLTTVNRQYNQKLLGVVQAFLPNQKLELSEQIANVAFNTIALKASNFKRQSEFCFTNNVACRESSRLVPRLVFTYECDSSIFEHNVMVTFLVLIWNVTSVYDKHGQNNKLLVFGLSIRSGTMLCGNTFIVQNIFTRR